MRRLPRRPAMLALRRPRAASLDCWICSPRRLVSRGTRSWISWRGRWRSRRLDGTTRQRAARRKHFRSQSGSKTVSGCSKRSASLTLTDFVIPLDDVPDDVQRAITHWAQWIDYWAVDWDNQSDTFHNEWQTYRTRKDKSLALGITHTYPDPGEYTIVVKVIDILGNDTTRSLQVEVT